MKNLELLVKVIITAPLIAAIVAGFLGNIFGKRVVRTFASSAVGLSFALSCLLAFCLMNDTLEINLYTWGNIAAVKFDVGFLVDKLTAVMLVVVTFVSFLVHVYTCGYMADDPGFNRFFSYIAFFTFAMLLLVLADNLLVLFVAWELVGLVSYLLIGFWFHKNSAVKANFKAFLVNRVADVGLILAVAAIIFYCGSVNFYEIFASLANISTGSISVIALCLFIGAMGKSAQFPLHIWLPDSMEGPTPISALIHAATMVTAGVYLIARMMPLISMAPEILDLILVIGVITSLLLGLVAITATDLKRIIAYSTISQLGYMVVALGVGRHLLAIFHLATHACFKALLFLAAGAVIMALHHQQDVRKMGNLRKYMPITYITMLVGCLALAGVPFFSGFYSKDLIIEAVAASNSNIANLLYPAVLAGVYITAIYSFRMLFLVFHTRERMGQDLQLQLRETLPVMYIPLIILSIASVLVGGIVVNICDINGGAYAMALHSLTTMPFLLSTLGIFTAWICYIKFPNLPQHVIKLCLPIYKFINAKYYLDCIVNCILLPGVRFLSNILYKVGDRFIIEYIFVNGIPKTLGIFASKIRLLQTGYLPQYILVMVVALIVFVVVL